MIRLILFSLLGAAIACAQYTAIQGTDYPANSLGILNSKPHVRTGAVAPTGNCTAGLDLYVDTATQRLYYCGALNVWALAGQVASVFGRTGAVSAQAGDYTAAQITNALDSTATYADPAWLTALAWGKLTGVPSTFAPSAHTHVAADTTGGVFDVSLIPDLSAAKITSGTLGLARLAQGGATNGQALLWNGSAWAPGAVSGGTLGVQAGGTLVGTRGLINLINSPGWVWAPVDDSANDRVNIGGAPDSAVFADRDTAASAVDIVCIDSSGSTTAKTCSPVNNTGPGGVVGKALAAYTNGMHLPFRSTSACSGATTLAVSALPARRLFAADGTSNPACETGRTYGLYYNATLDGGAGGWVFPASGGSSVTPATPYMIISGNYYLPGMYQATLPPTAGGGGWTLRGVGNPTLETTANGALRVTIDPAGAVDNFQWQSRQIGASRQLTVVLAANNYSSASCALGVARNASGNGLFLQALDNIHSNVRATVFSGLLNNTTYQRQAFNGFNTQFSPQALQYWRISISGGNVSTQVSTDFGISWLTVQTRSEGDTLGGAATATDQWLIGGTAAQSICTVLSWEAI